MKICSQCNEEKTLVSFHKKKSSKDGLQPKCKDCNIQNVQNWQNKNPEKYELAWKERVGNESVVHRRRAKRYGLTPDELTILLEQSGGVCEICKRKPNKWLVVDHCHNSNIVRGILCELCNQALGLFADNVEYMESAIKYLNKNKI